MADTVDTQVVQDGPRKAILKFTNLSSAGDGESGIKKVDVSTLASNMGMPCTAVRIDKVIYSTVGMSVQLLWQADTNTIAWVVPADASDTECFKGSDGPLNPRNTGWTGDILFTTIGHSTNDSYSIELHLIKKYKVY
jgi:hypothetical protein